MKLSDVIKNIVFNIIIFSCVLIFFSVKWSVRTFGDIPFAQIIFHLKVPLHGTDSSILLSYVKQSLLPSLLIIVCYNLITLNLFHIKVVLKLIIFSKEKRLVILPIYSIKKYIICLAIMLAFVGLYKIGIIKYISYEISSSTMIEENYVDPESITIKFPKQKRNLIYIYLESMETTYASKETGGAWNIDLIPELTEIASENINFSNKDTLGGALQFIGTGWTIAGLVSQTSGLPLKIPIDGNSYNQYSSFLPGVYSLGDILENEGYNQILMIGSGAEFAGRKNYFEQHGNYMMWDFERAKEEGKIPKDYLVFWGFEDNKLFSYAKEELSKLAKLEEPFNFTMLTVDTHAQDGYFCELCENKYDSQYANVISCSSKQVGSFIEWIKRQDFYQNTTIIIQGDHLSMESDFFDNIDNNYKRTTYNCFINSVIQPVNSKNRTFSTFDLFPSTLASLGVTINGNRLGLGTNLFSEEKTLVEIFGIEKFEEELSKNSRFYNKYLLYGERK